MTSYPVKPWALIVIPKPHELPGYAEAVAKVERGESLFPPERAKGPARTRRTVAELTAERDRLTVQRNRLTQGSDDPATARLGAAAIRAHHRNTDTQLARWADLTRRIDNITSKIARHP